MSIPDPWEEQRRRAREHRRARRRRRLLIFGLPLGVLLVAAAVVAVLVLADSDGGDEVATTDGSADTTSDTVDAAGVTTTSTAVTTTSVPTAPADPAPPTRPVDVTEVWLLDRGDGDFDWGLTVRVPEGGDARSDVAVRVRLIDADDEVLQTIERSLEGVNDRGPTAVAGRFAEDDGIPVRLDFDVAVGVASDDPGLNDLLDTRAVEREDNELRGRIRSSALDDVTDVAMVLVWRDDEERDESGAAPIVDVVVYDIERLRPAVDARFEIDLTDLRTPDGLPDDVFWSPTR